MPNRIVEKVGFIVPPGARGLVGFQLGAAGSPFLPRAAGQFFVTDDEKVEWPLDGQITSGAWQFFGYNLGQYAHTIRVRFWCSLIPSAGLDQAEILPGSALGSGPPGAIPAGSLGGGDQPGGSGLPPVGNLPPPPPPPDGGVILPPGLISSPPPPPPPAPPPSPITIPPPPFKVG